MKETCGCNNPNKIGGVVCERHAEELTAILKEANGKEITGWDELDDLLSGWIGENKIEEVKIVVQSQIASAVEARERKFTEEIKECFWQCPVHEELKTDGSCKECSQCLEVNVVLSDVLSIINPSKE